MKRRTLAAAVAVAMTLSAAATGCDGRWARRLAGEERGAVASEAAVPADSTMGATGTPSAGATSSADGPSGTSTDAELDALERELSAIEAELDALSLPTDADFRSAEDALF